LNINFQSEVPIYLQIARQLEENILTGVYPEETQVPSTTELSTGLQINPATVLKGMNQLVADGIIYKKRGVGMFVATGAAGKIRQARQGEFYDNYVLPLLKEAHRLGITAEELADMLKRGETGK
jgi:GntR family transcriptional regulator